MHIAINGTSMLFMALGENAEKSLLWKDHINPFLLGLGGVAFWYGLKSVQSERVDIS